MKSLWNVLLITCIGGWLFLPAPISSAEPPGQLSIVSNDFSEECDKYCEEQIHLNKYLETKQKRLQPFEPNYAIRQATDGDDKALEARYSFKYLITQPDCTLKVSGAKIDSREKCLDPEEYYKRWSVFLSYTGEFDFYFGTRESGPVINRVNNPAFHVRKYAGNRELFPGVTLKYQNFGVQHYSNGQVTDATRTLRSGVFQAQAEFERDPDSDYFDTISRGLNFVSYETSFRIGRDHKNFDPISGRCTGLDRCFDVWLRTIPWYIDDDNIVTWGPDAGRRNVADFDRVKVIVVKRTRFDGKEDWDGRGLREMELSAKWTIGDDGLKTDSFDVGLFLPVQFGPRWSIPLFIEYHHGPLNNLSNYSRSQSSFGVGLRFY